MKSWRVAFSFLPLPESGARKYVDVEVRARTSEMAIRRAKEDQKVVRAFGMSVHFPWWNVHSDGQNIVLSTGYV